ncbi:Uncharacterised protein [Weissella viridescens]|uniref:ASCH domain-containing protein n=1 Tax=Weissella viridescens TaxID=1629 RepID=A0A380P2V2_WEIVI|nr:Uncharacterised protein [Weissella viridescens]
MTPVVIDELAELVVKDKKVGTTSAVSLYEHDEPMPYVGALSIVLNSAEQPVAVIEATQVEKYALMMSHRNTHVWKVKGTYHCPTGGKSTKIYLNRCFKVS